MSTENSETVQELIERVEQLEEQQQRLVQGAVDSQGRAWSVSDFLNMGLTRRQALTAIAAIASGATLGVAIQEAVGVAEAGASTSDGDGDVGTPSNPVDVFADGVDATSVTTDEVNVANLGPRAYLSTNQTISANTTTKVTFDSETFDDEAEFDTANHQFVAEDSGRYSISATLLYDKAISSGVPIQALIYVNGSRVADCRKNTAASSYSSVSVDDTRDLAAGDYIEIYTRQGDSTSIDVFGGTDFTHVEITKEG